MFAFFKRGGRAAAREAEEGAAARARWREMTSRGYGAEGLGAYGGEARSAQANAVREADQLAMTRTERNAASQAESANAPAGAEKGPAKSTMKKVGETAAVAVPIAGAAGIFASLSHLDFNAPLNKLVPDTTKLGERWSDIFDPNKDKPLGRFLDAAQWIPYAFAAALVIPAFRVFVK